MQIKIILVQTTHAGNLGSVARAMKVMGLVDLILVNPQADHLSNEAIAMASHADDILKNAKVVKNLSEALQGTVMQFALSARTRYYSPPLIYLHDLPDFLKQNLKTFKNLKMLEHNDVACVLEKSIDSKQEGGQQGVQINCDEDSTNGTARRNLENNDVACVLEKSIDSKQEGGQQGVQINCDEDSTSGTARRNLEHNDVACVLEKSIAFVFGTERTGLENDDVMQCSHLLNIHTNPDYASLNLSQAVQLVAYELHRVLFLDKVEKVPNQPPAPIHHSRQNNEIPLAHYEQIQGMQTHFLEALRSLNYNENPQFAQRLMQLWRKAQLNTEEVNIIRGISKLILKKTEK